MHVYTHTCSYYVYTHHSEPTNMQYSYTHTHVKKKRSRKIFFRYIMQLRLALYFLCSQRNSQRLVLLPPLCTCWDSRPAIPHPAETEESFQLCLACFPRCLSLRDSHTLLPRGGQLSYQPESPQEPRTASPTRSQGSNRVPPPTP